MQKFATQIDEREIFLYFTLMKAIIDIPEAKAASIMDVLQSISYLKIIPLTDEKALLLQEIRESVIEMNGIKSKKQKARNARDFLNAIQSKNYRRI